MSIIYALANQKGGVGKTTTAVNVGSYLAEWGQQVLIVDADPQANATSALGLDKHAIPSSIYDLLVQDVPLARVIQPTRYERLSIVPASPKLAGATVELVGLTRREYRLHDALRGVDTENGDGYDYVLIDCPPSLGILTVNALTATNGVIIPVQCEYLALEGLSQLSRAIELVRRALNSTLQLRGLVMTMYDVRTTLAKQVVEEVKGYFPGRVFNTIIPRNVRVSEAPSYGEPIASYAPHSAGGLAYATLTKELLLGDGKIKAPAKNC
ncbi:MAG TPA: ParA family protein [Chloroflexi bacterium]|nr:ParA family protein [Chloroflexota bacterium]